MTVVESSRPAVADGRAALADLPQVRWRVGRVEDVLGRRPRVRRRTAVLAGSRTWWWPTRRGVGWAAALVDALAARAPARVVYVACDPAALARDVALFAGHGYRLDRPARLRRLPDDPPLRDGGAPAAALT